MHNKDHKPGRREPTLGNLEDLDRPAPREAVDDGLPRIRMPREDVRQGGHAAPKPSRHPPHRTPPGWRSWLWPLLAIVLVALLAWAWVNQDRLRAMLPRTHLNTMLMQADAALAEGHLEGSDGTSARELYARVLQQEPDNGDALRGLREVGRAELARASSAVDAGDFGAARRALGNARDILGGGAEIDKVEAELRKAEHPVKKRNATIARARKALAAGHVAGSDGAAALYQQVLKVDPDNDVARHGLEQAGDALAARAREALHQGDVDTAARLIDTLGDLLPRHGDLPSLNARLSQARQASRAVIGERLDRAREDLRHGRFTGHGENNALAGFQSVLKLDPDNAEARAGLEQVARALVLRANAAMDGGDAAQARELLEQAAGLAPDLADVRAAQARLDAMAADGEAEAAAAHSRPTELQKVEIRHLVQRAEAAADAGNIMLPPGSSAYDLYREALTIDADDAAARHGLAGLPDKVVALFDEAVAAHRLSRAGDYLATLRSLENGGARADALASKLADAWLDNAETSLDQGNRVAALKAIESARRLAPGSARLQALVGRLRSGGM